MYRSMLLGAAAALASLLHQTSALSAYTRNFLCKAAQPSAVLASMNSRHALSSYRMGSRSAAARACGGGGDGCGETLIVDTDMGPDDIAAIALLASHKAPIQLVTTVHGVCGDRLAAQLAQRIMSVLSPSRVEVVPGASRPLSGNENAPASWMIERRSQLADFDARAELPACVSPMNQPSVDAAAAAILEVVSASEQPATILALGPLSNVARAAEKDPASFRRKVGLLVFAGESSRSGSSICFNARLDLEALEMLLSMQVPLVFVGARSRMQSDDFYDRLGSYELSDNAASYLISEMCAIRPESIVDDPTAACFILFPDMFECEQIEVLCNADTRQFCRASVAEGSGQSGIRSVVLEAKSGDANKFVSLLRLALAKPVSRL